MDSNFVNIVWDQIEKTHTGVIKWMLDFKNTEVTKEQKYEILCRIYNICNVNVIFDKTDISNITCMPEFSFGIKRKADLVIRIDLNNGAVKYLVIEMKADSIPYESKLPGAFDDFIQSEKCKEEDALFLLFLFGTSQVCETSSLHEFHIFRLPEILEVFDGYFMDNYVYNDWIQALRDENIPRTCIKSDMDAAHDIWSEDYWREKGDRIWFPLFYYIYHKLRQYSKIVDERDIYSGENNSVMNWRQGCLEKNIMGSKVRFYWEFNHEDFILKVMLQEESKMFKDNLNDSEREVVKICDDQPAVSGNQAQKRYGVYKWKYDFEKKDFTEIMKEVDTILDCIHSELERV